MTRERVMLQLCVLTTFLLAGCSPAVVTPQGQQTEVTVSVEPSSAQVLPRGTVAFAAVATGTADTRVSWRVVESGGGTIAATGLYTAPGTLGTYHVVATSLADTNASGGATVSVVAAVSPPTISSFTAAPGSIVAGTSATLSWSVSGATSLSIAPGVGAVTGTSKVVAPAATTTYTLTAANSGGTVTATVVVTVTPASSPIDYHVGPGQPYANIGDVPWYALGPGDTVYIHYRPTPYREKFLISGRGTPSQWIRVLGVPGPGGELPVVSGDGATTSQNMHYHWQDATGSAAIQLYGVVQIAVHSDGGSGSAPIPGYIEIANLQIQDGYSTYRFTAENGTQTNYDGFAACIYVRSVQHLLVRNNVLTNCGQGFYNWTGDGSSNDYWAALEVDTVLRGNHFYNNGNAASYREHQTYTESDGVTIEYNWYGPQRPGAMGSQLKDRSAGTVIRYNYIEQSLAGWDLDLVEPQESWPSLGSKATFRQTFVYGNVIVNKTNYTPNLVHWNEDTQFGRGRATLPGGTLFFYDNTVVTVADQSDMALFYAFNATWGAYDCPPGSLPGVIDVRNNIFAVLPRTAGSPIPELRFGYCGLENFAFGNNWVSPGWTAHGATVTGTANLVSPTSNDPGFVDLANGDFHLTAGSSALGIGGTLAPEVTSNSLGLDLSPTQQYVYHGQVQTRPQSGQGSDAGAFER